MPSARDRLNAYVAHESDEDAVEFNALIDAVRTEARREVLGDDLNPSNLVIDAQAYRGLVTTIECTMTDPDRWDGDDDEATILGRYIGWLAAERGRVRAEALREAAVVVADLIADGEHDPDCLVDELRGMAHAAGKNAPVEGESTPAAVPDFFQPGRTYLRFVGDRELYFRVTSVSTDNPNKPDSLGGNGPVAFGWARTDRSLTVWGPKGETRFVGWRDVTEEAESR